MQMLISASEEMQKRLNQTQPTAGRSHPPGDFNAGRPPAHPDYRAQGVGVISIIFEIIVVDHIIYLFISGICSSYSNASYDGTATT